MKPEPLKGKRMSESDYDEGFMAGVRSELSNVEDQVAELKEALLGDVKPTDWFKPLDIHALDVQEIIEDIFGKEQDGS